MPQALKGAFRVRTEPRMNRSSIKAGDCEIPVITSRTVPKDTLYLIPERLVDSMEREIKYVEYIQSIEWTARRARFLVKKKCEEYHPYPTNKEHWHCKGCYARLLLGLVEVHHKTYDRLGQERDSDLEVLCRKCHILADKDRKERNRRRKRSSSFAKRAAGWGRKVYGPRWRKNIGVERVTKEFEAWLEAKGVA